jgi:hypothetical protein
VHEGGVDPDDAGPWLRLASEAAERHDTAAADEALYRASVARSFRSVGDALLLYAEPALSSGFSDADRFQVDWDILAVQGILATSPMSAAVRQCSEEAIARNSRKSRQLVEETASKPRLRLQRLRGSKTPNLATYATVRRGDGPTLALSRNRTPS